MSKFIYYIEQEDRFSGVKSSEFSEEKPLSLVLALNIILDRIKEIELDLRILKEAN